MLFSLQFLTLNVCTSLCCLAFSASLTSISDCSLPLSSYQSDHGCSHYLPTQFSTVFPYSQCFQFSLLHVELKSPLLKFCGLSLKLTILLLQLGIHLNLPIYIGKYHTDNHLYSTYVFTLIACASLWSLSISASFSCS